MLLLAVTILSVEHFTVRSCLGIVWRIPWKLFCLHVHTFCWQVPVSFLCIYVVLISLINIQGQQYDISCLCYIWWKILC